MGNNLASLIPRFPTQLELIYGLTLGGGLVIRGWLIIRGELIIRGALIISGVGLQSEVGWVYTQYKHLLGLASF